MSTKIPEPIQTEHDSDWHWKMFADFAKNKAIVKEPSPHMQMIGLLTEGKSKEDVVWFSGLYAAFYNIPSAMVMFKEWPWELAVQEPEAVAFWVHEHWRGLATRTERRTVRTPDKMAECILSYIQWAKKDFPQYIRQTSFLGSQQEEDDAYDEIWQDSDKKLRYMGRYIIIRLLEALHRFAGLKPRLYDIRSIGGWSPKRALALLYPENMSVLLSSDTKTNVQLVDAMAWAAMGRFKSQFNVTMSPYVFAALLCEYRVAYENRRQYPGWTIDQEPAYWYKIKSYWEMTKGLPFIHEVERQFTDVRKALFSEHCLGELNGWSGTRVEPRSVMRDHSYNWNDQYYKYNETTDFSQPVARIFT